MNDSLLLFSDVHADIGALEALLAIADSPDFTARYGPITNIINLGDVLQRGYHPAEVIKRLKGLKGLVSILGNHDESFLREIPVLGADRKSNNIHDNYFLTCEHEGFFKGMGKVYVDPYKKLYAVHGGPIDPLTIPPGERTIDDEWIYSQTWQRISVIGESFTDNSGYNYLPSQAFAAVKPAFGSDGFVIACGHNHKEAAFVQKGGAIEDVLQKLECYEVTINGHKVLEKKLPIGEDANYLVRLGIAGPEGSLQYGRDTCYFGVLTDKGWARTFYLLSFELGRKMEEHRESPEIQFFECE